MITLRVNPYSKKELERLVDLLKAMERNITFINCQRNVCKTCEYRHLCYDLTSAREHAEKLVKESKKK